MRDIPPPTWRWPWGGRRGGQRCSCSLLGLLELLLEVLPFEPFIDHLCDLSICISLARLSGGFGETCKRCLLR